MKIFIKVKTKANFERIEKVDQNHYKVYVRAIPQKNCANLAVIKLLAQYFKVDAKKVLIKAGLTKRNKVVEFLD